MILLACLIPAALIFWVCWDHQDRKSRRRQTHDRIEQLRREYRDSYRNN